MTEDDVIILDLVERTRLVDEQLANYILARYALYKVYIESGVKPPDIPDNVIIDAVYDIGRIFVWHTSPFPNERWEDCLNKMRA